MVLEAIQRKVHDYVAQNFIFDAHTMLGDDQSLLGSGVIDSTGILELIAFVEGEFGIHFEDAELVADNFDSVNKVAASIVRKITTDGAPHHVDQ